MREITDLDRKAWAYSDQATNEGHEAFALCCHRAAGRARTAEEQAIHETTLNVAFGKRGIDLSTIKLLGDEPANHRGAAAVREIWVGRKKWHFKKRSISRSKPEIQ